MGDTSNFGDGTATTSTQARGVYIRPRLPDFEFDESLPRDHAGSTGETAFINAVSVFANVGERMFIRSGKLMLPTVGREEYEDELANFIAQEAYHSRVHERLNKVLRNKGYPIEEYRTFLQAVVDGVFEVAGHRMVLATSLAGEQAIGVFGDALLENPSILDEWDDEVRRLFLWHSYEEVEHTAALFDSFHLAVGNPAAAYKMRMWGAAYLLVVLAGAWGAGLFVFMQHEGKREGLKLRNWKDAYSFLFGEHGVLSKSRAILKDYPRRDFHPWDGRNAYELLQRHKGYVSPEWDMTDKSKPRPVKGTEELNLDTLRKEVNNFTEACRFAKFLVKASYRTARFLLKSVRNGYWRDKREAYETRTTLARAVH